jgi:hypothetical protein
MATFTLPVQVPDGIKDNNQHTLRIQWRSAVPEVLGKADLRRARETFGYTVYRWDDEDKDGTRVTMTRMDKDGRHVWLYATYYYTRVACKVCIDHQFKAQSYAEYYVLIVGKGMNTTEPFPICGLHLHDLRRSTAGGELELHLSERLVTGQH